MRIGYFSKKNILIAVLQCVVWFGCQNNRSNNQHNSYQNDSLTLNQRFDSSKLEEIPKLIEEIKEQKKHNAELALSYYFTAKRRLASGDLTAALVYSDSSLKADTSQDYPNNQARFLNLKAGLLAYVNEQEQSIQLYQEAFKLSERVEDLKLTATLAFNVANISFSRQDFTMAYDYSKKASNLFHLVGDSIYSPIAQAIYAVALIKLDSLPLADSLLTQIIVGTNPLAKCLHLYGLAELSYGLKNLEKAEEHYKNALDIAKSYQLSALLLPIGAALSNCLYLRSKDDEALFYVFEAIERAKSIENKDILLNLYRTASKVLYRKQVFVKAYHYLASADSMQKIILLENNQKSIQELLVKYESELKNAEILKQANLIQSQKISILYLLIFASIILIGLFYLYKNRQLVSRQAEIQVKEAMIEGEEQERERIALELHDGVNAALLGIRLKLEEYEYAKPMADQIRSLQDEIRLISANLVPLDFKSKSLGVHLSELCSKLSENQGIKFIFMAKDDRFSPTVAQSMVLYRMAQETLQNAIKHSNCENIYIQIKQNQQQYMITIEDDGKGFNPQNEYAGMGLKTLKKRAQKLGAELEIESDLDKGTMVIISLKIKKR